MSTDEKQKIQQVAATLHKQAPDFRAFAHRICDLFFEDSGGPVEYDDFIDAGIATGVILERPFNPDDPHDQALADEWGETEFVYSKNFK